MSRQAVFAHVAACVLMTIPSAASAGILDVPPETTIVFGYQVHPGDTLRILGPRRGHLTLMNLVGGPGDSTITVASAPGEPVTFVEGGLEIQKCRHLHVTGGEKENDYGLVIEKVGWWGIAAYKKSSFLEIDHVEVRYSTGGITVFTKYDAADSTTWSYPVRDVIIHDNYIHDVDHEGLYVGVTGTDPFPSQIHHLELYANLLERTGWDGIQISNAVEEVLVHDNAVDAAGGGSEHGGNQRCGLVVQLGSGGVFYSNRITRSVGPGMYLDAPLGVEMYNNVVAASGGYGVNWPHGGGYFYNNTIAQSGGCGVSMRDACAAEIYNNLVAGHGPANSAIYVAYPKLAHCSYNVEEDSVTAACFRDPEQLDYRLDLCSPAIDAGSPSGYPPTDIDGVKRPLGDAVEIGAYEYDPEAIWLDVVAAAASRPGDVHSHPGRVLFDFGVSGATTTTVHIYDVRGRHIRTLIAGSSHSGSQTAVWDGTDALGKRAAAGIYLARISAGGVNRVAKCLLVR